MESENDMPNNINYIRKKQSLEDHICILRLSKNISSFRCLFLACLLSSGNNLRVCFGGISLLFIRDLLESVELFSVELIEFRVDV